MADTDVTAEAIVADAEAAAETLQQAQAEIAKAVFGQERVVELSLAAVLAGGHAHPPTLVGGRCPRRRPA